MNKNDRADKPPQPTAGAQNPPPLDRKKVAASLRARRAKHDGALDSAMQRRRALYKFLLDDMIRWHDENPGGHPSWDGGAPIAWYFHAAYAKPFKELVEARNYDYGDPDVVNLANQMNDWLSTDCGAPDKFHPVELKKICDLMKGDEWRPLQPYCPYGPDELHTLAW